MNHDENILNKLRGHAIPPPEECYSKILSEAGLTTEAESESSFEQLDVLKNHSLDIPLALQQQLFFEIEEERAAYAKKLAALKEYSQPQPAGSFEAIWTKIRQAGNKSSGAVVRMLNQYRAAAAVAALVIISGIIYLAVSSDTSEEKMPVAVKQETPISADTIAAEKSDTIQVTTEPVPHPALHHRMIVARMQRENIFFSDLIIMDGWKQGVRNQDMLAAFASYKYEDIPGSFWQTADDQMVYIQADDFTAVGVSSKMRTMMKRMYEVKKNGKSTAKAKREKRKLNRWIKADKKRFDHTLSSNPLDPLDLADFIFD